MGGVLMKTKINLIYTDWYYSKTESGNRYRFPNGMTRGEIDSFNKIQEEHELSGDLERWVKHKNNPDIYQLGKDNHRPYTKIGPFQDKITSKAYEWGYHSLDDVKDDEIYFYVIELLQPTGFFRSFSRIPQEIKDLINQDRCYLIYDYEHEGLWDFHKFEEFYFASLHNDDDVPQDIKLENIYILTGDLNCNEILSNDIKIKFVNVNHFLDGLAYDVLEMKKYKRGIQTEFGYRFEPKSVEDIDVDNKTKLFNSTMRNCQKRHRKALGSYFHYHDLWKDNNISFLKVNMDSDIPHFLPTKYRDSCKKLSKMPIVELDTHDMKEKNNFGTMWDSWNYYQESFITVVSETLFEGWPIWREDGKEVHYNVFFSEKILKPIMNVHPFIVFSVPGFLHKLHHLGFQTFNGDFLSEKYDLVQNEQDRLKLLFTELDKFRTTPVDELKQWFTEQIPKLKHNQELFLEYGRKSTTKVKLLEKLRNG